MKLKKLNKKIEDELDRQFPKGDKARGRALVLHAIAQIELKKKTKKQIIYDYDKKNDILFINWGGKCNCSIEVCDGKIVLDLDKKGRIIGIQIFEWNKELRKNKK